MNDGLKKALVTLFSILFLISIFKDITTGTFSFEDVTSAKQSPPQEIVQEQQPKGTRSNTNESQSKRYQKIEHHVKAGETVLSIMENINKTGPPVSIQQMIQDFESLNPNIDAHQIQINKSYWFPIYRE